MSFLVFAAWEVRQSWSCTHSFGSFALLERVCDYVAVCVFVFCIDESVIEVDVTQYLYFEYRYFDFTIDIDIGMFRFSDIQYLFWLNFSTLPARKNTCKGLWNPQYIYFLLL